MKRYSQVAAFILAGGASSRMGQDKAALKVAGVPLIVMTARRIEPLVSRITVVGSPHAYSAASLRAIPDQAGSDEESKRSRLGPLAGIAAALSSTLSAWNLIVACDLPYLSQAWLEWLLARAVRSRCQAVIPRSARGLEPLAGVYHRECSGLIAATLARGVRRVTDAIGELRLEVIDERMWRHLDSRGMLLKNMNTPEDYEQARRFARIWGRV